MSLEPHEDEKTYTHRQNSKKLEDLALQFESLKATVRHLENDMIAHKESVTRSIDSVNHKIDKLYEKIDTMSNQITGLSTKVFWIVALINIGIQVALKAADLI